MFLDSIRRESVPERRAAEPREGHVHVRAGSEPDVRWSR